MKEQIVEEIENQLYEFRITAILQAPLS